MLSGSRTNAARLAPQEVASAGGPITAELVSRYCLGRRPADMFAAIETVTKRRLPENFGATVAAATIRRCRTELRAMPHVAHALTWLREPKCVASSSTLDRIRASLETTGLARFFEPNLFSASEVPNGKPAPDLLLHVAAQMGVARSECIVVEDSPAGITAATAAGMTAIGFVGGSHAGPSSEGSAQRRRPHDHRRHASSSKGTSSRSAAGRPPSARFEGATRATWQIASRSSAAAFLGLFADRVKADIDHVGLGSASDGIGERQAVVDIRKGADWRRSDRPSPAPA